MSQKSKICVVYLSRAADGLEPWENFLRSYSSFPGGIDHNLLIIFKGFESDRQLADYRAHADGLDYSSLRIKDYGFDITSYRIAAEHLGMQFQYLCFLNTSSQLLDQHWLRKLHAVLKNPSVGIAGATGSYQSMYSCHLNGLKQGLIRSKYYNLREQAYLRLRLHQFPPFPNAHIRTNGFMIRANLMQQVWVRNTRTKFQAMRFESGADSLTTRIVKKGLNVLVVGRNGVGYERKDWPFSRTFRIGHQDNLLIADKRTAGWIEADEATKRRGCVEAWGFEEHSDEKCDGLVDLEVSAARQALDSVSEIL